MDKLIRLASANPIAAILLSLMLCSLAGAGITGLTLNASYTAYFPDDDPALSNHETLKKRFSMSDGVLIALAFERPEALSTQALEILANVVSAIESLPYVASTRSILDLPASATNDFDAFEAELLGLEADDLASQNQ